MTLHRVYVAYEPTSAPSEATEDARRSDCGSYGAQHSAGLPIKFITGVGGAASRERMEPKQLLRVRFLSPAGADSLI